MPQINLIHPGQPVSDFSTVGTVVAVAGVSVDAASVQGDSTTIVEIRHNGAAAQIGGEGAYLAHIEVPPAQYSLPIFDEESGALIGAPERLPLDPNTIIITLWPTA